MLVNTFWPKRRFEMVPQKSPPVARRSCVPVLSRSQSGRKLLLASVHVRVTPGGESGFLQHLRAAGEVMQHLFAAVLKFRATATCLLESSTFAFQLLLRALEFGEFVVRIRDFGFNFLARGWARSRDGLRGHGGGGAGDSAEAEILFRGFVIRVYELRFVESRSHARTLGTHP